MVSEFKSVFLAGLVDLPYAPEDLSLRILKSNVWVLGGLWGNNAVAFKNTCGRSSNFVKSASSPACCPFPWVSTEPEVGLGYRH